jgi:hypothetical protein
MFNPGTELTQTHLIAPLSRFFSSASTHASSSATSIIPLWVEISPMISLASRGDSSPAAQAAMIADDALRASCALYLRQFEFHRAFAPGRNQRAQQGAQHGGIPWRAFSTALAPSASPWPSINASTARVTRLRAPLGRPFGLPLCPG